MVRFRPRFRVPWSCWVTRPLAQYLQDRPGRGQEPRAPRSRRDQPRFTKHTGSGPAHRFGEVGHAGEPAEPPPMKGRWVDGRSGSNQEQQPRDGRWRNRVRGSDNETEDGTWDRRRSRWAWVLTLVFVRSFGSLGGLPRDAGRDRPRALHPGPATVRSFGPLRVRWVTVILLPGYARDHSGCSCRAPAEICL
jgi:hypothetical protein